MDAYAFALTLGTAGLAAMTVLGFHHGHAPGSSARGHHSTHFRGGGRAGGRANHQHHSATSSRLLLFLSPRLWFSLLVGFGATGLLVGGHATAGIRLGVALLGALAFEALFVRPIWSLATRFASDPAMTLETGVMDDAEAVTGFNAKGEGLVRLDLDGQVVQLLGVLTSSERDAGIRIAAGDRLLVEAVDPARQRCTVSRRDSAGPLGDPSSL
jgi:translation initiation factor IF-1